MTMVLLDFDEQSLLARRTGASLWEADEEVPVRLRINGIELLGWERGWSSEDTHLSASQANGASEGIERSSGIDERATAGITSSVISMAWWGPLALQLAKQTWGSTLWLGMYGDRGELLFRMSETGEDVLVHSTPYRRTAQVRYEELEVAWKEFAQRVRDFLMSEFPDLLDQPFFGEWKEPGWQEWLAGKEASHLPVKLPMEVSAWSLQDSQKYVHLFS
jgi:hypothetical protein